MVLSVHFNCNWRCFLLVFVLRFRRAAHLPTPTVCSHTGKNMNYAALGS